MRSEYLVGMLLLLGAGGLELPGCSRDSDGSCSVGDVAPCACRDGQIGVRTCSDRGIWNALCERCQSAEDADRPDQGACSAGESAPCTCTDGKIGVRMCTEDGLWNGICERCQAVVVTNPPADPVVPADPPVDPPVSPPPDDCGFRKSIRVDRTRVSPSSGADLASFPVLVQIPSDPELRSKANGGNVRHNSGADLLFLRGGDLATLDYEVERYEPTTGELTAWVRVPVLSASADTIFYLYYGCGTIDTSRQNPAAVWPAGYRGVWHLNGNAQSMLDSTANHSNVSETVGTVSYGQAGKIGPAVVFPQTGALSVSDRDCLDVSQFTVSAWIKLDRTDVLQMALSKGEWGTTLPFELGLVAGVGWLIQIDPGGSPTVLHGGMPVAGQWYHVLARYTGAELSLWVDGTKVNQVSVSVTLPNNAYPVVIGDSASAGLTCPLAGVVDEARLSSQALSDHWIRTGYANEGAPSTFFTLGPQEAR